jgi:hypothetical protein
MNRERAYPAPPNHRTEAATELEGWDDAVTLWREIYGDGPGFVALFSGTRPTTTAALTAVHEAYFAWPRETAAAARWLEREAQADRELYHCAHLVRRWRRRKQDAARIHALWVDLDGPLPATPPLAPTLTVESSPKRYQLYFRLSHAVTPGQAQAHNRSLAQLFGADLGGWDLTQLLRVPGVGSVNHKYAARPSVRLVAVTNRVYAPEELPVVAPLLAPAVAAESSTPRPAPPIWPVGTEPPIPLTRAAQQLWYGEGPLVKRTRTGEIDRSAALVQLARILAAAKLPAELTLAHLAERDATLFGKYTERADAAAQYQRIVDLVAQGSPTRRQRR